MRLTGQQEAFFEDAIWKTIGTGKSGLLENYEGEFGQPPATQSLMGRLYLIKFNS